MGLLLVRQSFIRWSVLALFAGKGLDSEDKTFRNSPDHLKQRRSCGKCGPKWYEWCSVDLTSFLNQSHFNAEMQNIPHPNEAKSQPKNKNADEERLLQLFGPAKDGCGSCSDLTESWICLICGHLGCGRYKQKHAQEHAVRFHHRICLQVSTGTSEMNNSVVTDGVRACVGLWV